MQPDLTLELLELVRLASTSLPPDVEKKIRACMEEEEPGSAARGALETVLRNVEMARENSTPICQDTGTPIFYVQIPQDWSRREFREQVVAGVVQATEKTYLRPNAVNTITGKNTGDNTGDEYYPTVHYEEVDPGEPVVVELMLKGGGSENVGAQYKLPDSRLGAGRDLEGVRKVVLDVVNQAQGKGCAPGALGVGIGGDRGSSFLASKEALFRQIDDINPNPVLADLEARITEDVNQLGIGPMGFGGKTTVLTTKIKGLHRLPACYFVSVTYMCWAYRRRKMVWDGESAVYK